MFPKNLHPLAGWFLLAAPLLFAQKSALEVRAEREARGDRQREEEFHRLRAHPMAAIPPGARAAAVRDMERMIAREKAARSRAAALPGWTPIGPRPTNVLPEDGPGGAGSPYAAGRVTALAVDPRNANTIYLGGMGGGVWKTTDGGQNWAPLTDDQPSLAIGSIALAPSNPDIVYVGTGEQNNSGDSYYGAGVLKSSDGGSTWTQLGGPFVGPFGSSRVSGGGARIGALAVHPADPNTVLAAVDRSSTTASGIYRTTDGGITWTLVLSGAVGTDVVFNPANASIVYAALGSVGGNAKNGVYKSTDGGATWNVPSGPGITAFPTANVGRIALALAPSSPNTLYAGVQISTSGSLLGMYKTTDGAQTWGRLLTPDYCTPQCFYNNVIRVNPANPNLVVAGGLPPWRSTDGGVTWTNIAIGSTGLTAHTDHHALAFSSDGSVLYDGDDGGVFRTSNLSAASPAWTNLNATLNITEFSSNVSIHPTDPHIAFGGTQDNGTQGYTGGPAWDQYVGGDGGSTAIDPAIPSIWYGMFPGGGIYKLSGVPSLADLQTRFVSESSVLRNGIAAGERNLFYPRLVMDPSNPLRLYYGTQRLYQTNDGAGTWTAISPDLTASNSGVIDAIAVSPSLPRVVAVGTNNGKVQVTDSADQGAAAVWNDRSAGLPGRAVSQVICDLLDPSTLYITLSGFSRFLTNDNAGHVFKTTDFGQTWTDISGVLPNIPVNDIVLDPDVPDTVYIATDIGVFQSSDGGQTWSTFSEGLPRVLVGGLNLHRPSRTLRAVTQGRGMWDMSVPVGGPSQAPYIASVAPASVGGAAGQLTITLSGSNFVSSSVARWNGSDRPTTFVNASTLRVTLPASDLAKAGRATLIVYNPVAGGGLSNSLHVPVGAAPLVTAGGITSAANPLVSGPLVPGSIHSIYGSNLAADTVVAAAPPLPYTLGGVTVEVNGIPAPLFFVSPGQVNFQVPWEVEYYNRVTVALINGTQSSTSLQVSVAPAAPALFSTSGRGSGQGAISISGSSAIAAPAGAFTGSRPAGRGEFLQIYATGMGQVSRIQGDGQPKSNAPLAITKTPDVTIGGVPAAVSFSGLAPGAVGLYQINVQVPDGAPFGDAVPVVVSLDGATSNTVTVAVQ